MKKRVVKVASPRANIAGDVVLALSPNREFGAMVYPRLARWPQIAPLHTDVFQLNFSQDGVLGL